MADGISLTARIPKLRPECWHMEVVHLRDSISGWEQFIQVCQPIFPDWMCDHWMNVVTARLGNGNG